MRTHARKTHNGSAAPATALDPHYAKVVRAFSKDRGVTRETRKGFGSGAVTVNGKIFAMMTPRGEFVAKVPEKRVDESWRPQSPFNCEQFVLQLHDFAS